MRGGDGGGGGRERHQAIIEGEVLTWKIGKSSYLGEFIRWKMRL